MMKFYQENKVNPFGSCLPLVAQLPVFISLFYMLRKDLKIDICGPESVINAKAAELGKSLSSIGCDQVRPGSASFLFINDLTVKATGATLAVLLVLYVGSQLLSSVLMSVTADRNQRFIMIALPFVFVPFIQSFPAGLCTGSPRTCGLSASSTSSEEPRGCRCGAPPSRRPPAPLFPSRIARRT